MRIGKNKKYWQKKWYIDLYKVLKSRMSKTRDGKTEKVESQKMRL